MLSLRIDIHPRKIWLDSVETTSTSFTKRLVIARTRVRGYSDCSGASSMVC